MRLYRTLYIKADRVGKVVIFLTPATAAGSRDLIHSNSQFVFSDGTSASLYVSSNPLAYVWMAPKVSGHNLVFGLALQFNHAALAVTGHIGFVDCGKPQAIP